MCVHFGFKQHGGDGEKSRLGERGQPGVGRDPFLPRRLGVNAFLPPVNMTQWALAVWSPPEQHEAGLPR